MAVPPRDPEHPSVTTWLAGQTLWRVSRDIDGLAFSTSAARRNRFSPMYPADGITVIGAWYGATSQVGALLESVFHDIRPSHRHPRVHPNQYVDRYLSPVITARDLLLVDLTSIGLQAIGLSRHSVIESTSRRYEWTNSIAARLRAAAPAADGFLWTSRAHDPSQCVVLFDDPGRATTLAPHPTEHPLALGLGPGLHLLRAVATDAKITVILASP